MNRVNLTGRATRNPEARHTQDGKVVCRLGLAVQRKFKNASGDYECDFINCIAFGKTAELIEQYILKGDQIGIDGRIQTGSYTNKDGIKVYTTDVVVDSIDFLTQKKKEEKSTPYDYEQKQEVDPFAEFGETIEDNFLD